MKSLKWSDRNAPLPFTDTTVVPFDKAMATVLAAYESFSPILTGIIQGFISAKRIDAPATKGKRGGAAAAEKGSSCGARGRHRSLSRQRRSAAVDTHGTAAGSVLVSAPA
jgi:hypothetical protein